VVAIKASSVARRSRKLRHVELSYDLTLPWLTQPNSKRYRRCCHPSATSTSGLATSSPLTDVWCGARDLIHSRLDYCNSILANAPLCLLNCLQSVISSSARLVLRFRPSVCVSKLIRDHLHWLPVQQRIAFKLKLHWYKQISNDSHAAVYYTSPGCVPPLHQ